MRPPLRHFLGWDRPLLPAAVAWLAQDASGGPALDLSATLVIVPTRQSGRRLREALAAFAARRGGAVFPPRVLTPEAVLAEARSQAAPSRLSSVLSWVDVLRKIDFEAYRDVFPVDPPTRNFSWAIGLADRLLRVQTVVAERGLRLRDIAPRVGTTFPEYARWVQLGELEELHARRLAEAGFGSDEAAPNIQAVIDALSHDRSIDGTDRNTAERSCRVVLLATPDPVPQLVEALRSGECAVDVVVFAPAHMAASFDEWGRPTEQDWTKRLLDWPDFEQCVHLCSDPQDEAARIISVAAEYHAADREVDRIDIGVADAEVAAMLDTEAAGAGVPVFDPQGRRHGAGALHALLRALAFRSESPSFAEIEALARCPDFLGFAGARVGAGFSAARFLAALDRVKRDHLPATLRETLAHATADPDLRPPLEVVAELAARLRDGTFPANLAAVLADIFGERSLERNAATDLELQDAADVWTTTAREITTMAEEFPDITATEWRELALRTLGEARYATERPAEALEIQGWLELPFTDAPHLAIAGMNDGILPETVNDDAFLPDTLRRTLGLRHNATRFARDAYLLEALIRSRAAGGRVDVFLAKTSTAGDPLRPSRLLLRCADETLPARVRFLFQAPDRRESHLAWRRAWKLQPRRVAPPAQIAVTALRRWLACPFRFYLKYALRMEAVDAAKGEMDAFDFGRLCHGALEAMGRDATMRACTDPAALREFLLGKLAVTAEQKFGRHLALPLVIQIESARQRLAKFAEIQARERAAGWVIEQVERPITLAVGAMVVRGQVDRIDRHERTGAVRVLDYKTSDSGVAPRAAHLRAWRADEALPEWARVTVDGRARAWADLQLPVYREALAREFGTDISVGYFTLPKAVGETVLALWDDYTPELHASAMACAAGVCAAIERGEFWPPAENIRPDSDEFASLFHEGVAASIAWDAMQLRVER